MLPGEIATELVGRVSEVALIHDVAIEPGPGLVAGDIHGDPFGNASAG
jgi:hypothetical protein